MRKMLLLPIFLTSCQAMPSYASNIHDVCAKRTRDVFYAYTALEQNKQPNTPLLETEIAKQWKEHKLGDKMDLVMWYYKSCIAAHEVRTM